MFVYLVSGIITAILYNYIFYGYLIIFRQFEVLVESKNLIINTSSVSYSFSIRLDKLSFFLHF